MDNLFERLPDELLLEIFAYELLVPCRKVRLEREEVSYSQGITIIEGKAEHTYPTALFKVDKRTSWLARTYAFSKNRFILGGGTESTIAWLASQPQELINMIRRLDLLILPYQLYIMESLDSFPQLLAVLDDYFELGTLCLSVNASRICQEVHGKIPNNKLLQIFQDNQDVRKVKDFFVHYPHFEAEEVTLEKSMKGSDYDSVARGKEKIITRNYRLWESLVNGYDWGFDSDYEEYADGYMISDESRYSD